MAQPQLSLLGGFEIAGDRPPGATFTRKARAMLAYLALQPGRSQSREKLAALLWGGNGEVQARTNLRQALAAVRHTLPILIDGDGVALDLDGIDFDVARFETLAADAAPEALEQALALYRGDLLDGFSIKEEPFEDWLRIERERLRALAVGALEKLIAHAGAGEDHAGAVKAAIRLLSLEPLREDIHRTVMRAYAAQGRFNLALKQYEICRAALQQELGLQPDPETSALFDALRKRRIDPPKAPVVSPQSLPLLSRSAPVRRQRTHYVKSGDCNIAYQVTGSGPIDLVYVSGWVSNLDYAWANPRFVHVLERLGGFARLIRFDKRGTGLSDRGHGYATLEQRMEDVRAVLDAVGSERTVLFGSSEGGNMCMLFAAAYPERTSALVLNGAYARGLWAADYPWAKTPEEVEEELAAIERDWGEPADLRNAAPSLVDDPFEREWFAAFARNSASPADAIAAWRWATQVDVRDILPAIRVPTLIVQRIGDRWVKPEEGRYLARHIAGARYFELEGDDHLIWGQDCDRLVDTIRDFVATLSPPPPSAHLLMTVLAIETTADESMIRDAVGRNDGLAAGRIGHAHLAAFRGPTQAIQCATSIRALAREFRAAIHIGECEQRGAELGGATLELTAGLLDEATQKEIVVSRTLRDIMAGPGLVLEARGPVYRLGEPQV